MSSIKQAIESSVGLSNERELDKLYDYITKQEIQNTPENREAKVVIEERLHQEYLYSLDQMTPEFSIRKGSVLIGNADVVVFHDSNDKSQENIKIIVECKRKNRKDGIDQLKTYLAGCQSAEYGVWFNGEDIVYIKRLPKSPHWKTVYNIPRKGENLGLPEKSSLQAATELVKVFETCHNHIYANDGHLKDKVFNEMLKILFIKLMDERDYTNKIAKFGITEEEYDEILDGKTNDFEIRIESLFKKAKDNYKDIFNSNDKINLKLSTLAFVVGQMQYFDLSHSSRDVKGLAFQKFVYAHQRGDRGEFFTPDPIIELAVKMIKPRQDEIILDPACGTGGFLVAAMKYVENSLSDLKKARPVDFEKAKTDFALRKLRGIDFNPDLVRVAKMRMILEEDGHTGIFHANSLDSFEKIKQSALLSGANNIEENSVDIILTNPPFGKKGTISDKEILKQFDLGKQWKKEDDLLVMSSLELDEQVPDVLFIERCYHFLKNKGRMAIVLPDGILSGPKLQYVRNYIFNKFKIVGVVSLPYSTFIPHGANVKASILLLQKLTPKSIKKINEIGYQTFMVDIEKIGYQGNKTGTLIYKIDSKGEFILDENGEKILDEEITESLFKWEEFEEENKVWY
ncbi:restriction endonuclease subunit M [Lysinibacillus capsici]|uniref:restriction endonuclease subunit M n=1 Tax=Lysinibacillus capsici TaxID=2115968 RepID=UPI00308185CE|nr:N-6 DNA methylase [Lysinibacillus capsici]